MADSKESQESKAKSFGVHKPKAPVAAQILYALGFLGLIGGLLAAVLLFATTSTSSRELYDILNFFGLSGTSGRVAALLVALIVAGAFALIDQIKAGKKWALTAFTALSVFGFLGASLDIITMSELEKLFSNRSFVDLWPYAIEGLLLWNLWTAHKEYFK